MNRYDFTKPDWMGAWIYCLFAHVVFSFVFILISNGNKLFTFKIFEVVLVLFLSSGVLATVCVLILHIFAYIFIRSNMYSLMKLTPVGLFLGCLIGLSLSGLDIYFSNGFFEELKKLRPIFFVSIIYGGSLGLVFAKGLHRNN